LEKEKHVYEFENTQAQLDKALGHSARVQKEKEVLQLDADRFRDKTEKIQVNLIAKFYIALSKSSHILFKFQVSFTRLQKERDILGEESEKLKERCEHSQSLFMKAQRELDTMQTEMDVVKERWEKAHSVHQKLQVGIYFIFHL
jgi:golgin subfamily B member 1